MLFEFYILFVLFHSIQCQWAFQWESTSTFCNIFDTINITDGVRNENESITYNGISYAKENYGLSDYTYLPNEVRIAVPLHIRGCICEYKNCVRLCCPVGYSSSKTVINDRWNHYCELNNKVTESELKTYLHLNHDSNIAFVSAMPCYINAYWLDVSQPWGQWKMLPNGSLLIGEYYFPSPLVVEHDKYCIGETVDPITGIFTTNVMFCRDLSQNNTSLPSGVFAVLHDFASELLYPGIMLLSAIMLSITLFVYCWVKELRTLPGKILMCYILTLIIGYLLWSVSLIMEWYSFKGKASCFIIAEVAHSAYIAGFVWLIIVGYNIWRTVNQADQSSNQFIKYCIFACGTTSVIVLITNILDHVNLLEPRYRPLLGVGRCWLNSEYSYFLYYYTFIMIVIVVNTVFFILSKRKIDKNQKYSNKFTSTPDSRKFVNDDSEADHWRLLFRLSIIMGLPCYIEFIAWLMSVFVYYELKGYEFVARTMFYIIFSIANVLHGPYVFYLSVSKPRIKRLLKERCLKLWKADQIGT